MFMCICIFFCVLLYIFFDFLYIRRASGPRRGEITVINLIKGLPPPTILPLGGPGAKSW